MRLSTLLPLMGLLAIGYAKKSCPRQRTSPGKEILCYTSSNNADELLDAICRCTTLVHQGHQLHNLSTAAVEELQKTLKEVNPVLQIVVSVTDPQGTLKTSATTRQEASGRLANILSQVDGVELDMTAGSKERLSHFVKGLKDEMIRKSNEKRILLALPTKPEELAKQYDLKTLTKYVDLFTISTHYLVDDSESFRTFHPSRLMGIFDMLNTDSLVDLVSGLGAPKKKLLISLPASAYKFTLKDAEKNVPGSPVKEEVPTPVSQKELCGMMTTGEWTVERDTDLTAPYAFKDSTWISYEDKSSVGIKGKYVLLRELAGLGVHNIENDVKNDCGKPITHEVYRSFTDMKRKTRGAVLASLENDLQHEQIPQSRHVKSSGFRIVRVVDTAGAIHAIRENTQTEFMCTRQGYFVHPKSCNRFYRCVKFDQGVDDYSVFEFDCPAGLAFDERTEVCVWPGSLTEGSPCPGSSEIAPVPRARFVCPQEPGYYADPQNCRWFFACFDLGEPELTAYEFRCPFGLVFDEKKLICEWPWLVPGCGVSGYSRTEYGGPGYVKLQGHGSGSGQGSIAGGAGFGDYSGIGIGAAGASGQYGSAADSSSYPGSRGSESRQTETGAGAGADGLKYSGYGAGGSQFNNLGQRGHGSYSGSGNFGAGSGIGSSGFGGSGIRYNQANDGHSGSGASFEANSGSGAAFGSNSGSGAGIYGQGGNSGSENGGSIYGGIGATNTLYSGAGSGGVKYSNQGSGSGLSSGGNFGGYEFGARFPTSPGSGSAQSEYSGQTGSTVSYNGLGKTGVVIETQGHDSSIYTTGGTGSGHSAPGGYSGFGSTVNTAGNSGYNGFGSTASSHQAFGEASQEIGKDGLTVSVQTGGSHDASSGITGSDLTANSGYHPGANYDDGSEYSSGSAQSQYSNQGNSGYTSSGGRASDSQDVINTGSISGSGILTGSTGTIYRGGAGSRGGYTSGVTKNTFNALDVFGVKRPGTSSPAILVQSVTPGYAVGGIAYGGSSTGAEHVNGGGFVTGSGYVGNTGSGNVVIDHGSDYGSGYVSGTSGSGSGATLVNTAAGHQEARDYVGTGSSSTVSDIGKGGISTGTTTYHGNGGASSSYLSSKTNSNSNANGNYDSGSVSSHGDGSGVIINGNAGLESVYGSTIRPEYVSTNTATAGYEIHGVTQTAYGNTAPGTFLTGTAAPGVILHGTSGSGSYLAGQNHEGSVVSGATGNGIGVTGTTTYYGNAGSSGQGISSEHGAGFSRQQVESGFLGSTVTDSGSKTSYVGNGASFSGQKKGYKTNEYESNGGRGTITFNNGYTASKYTESDLQPTYASLPDTIVSGGRIDNSGGVVLGNTLAGVNFYNSQGFAKTDSTKTGGSYVSSTGFSRPTPTPGSNVFVQQNSGKGYSVATSIGNDVNNLAYVTSTASPDTSYVDTSKINLGHGSAEGSSGYTYRKPTVAFGATGGSTASTPTPLTVTYHQPIVPLTVTTPAPYLNVEAVYNTPSVVTSAPITATPAVVNTYSYRRPSGASSTFGGASSGYKYRRPGQTVVQQSSGDGVQRTTVYRRPVSVQKQYSVVSTTAPIAYATGPSEVYKSTLFEAAKQPITVSTVAPVFDTGYKTVVSSTASPIAVTTGEYFYSDSRLQTGSASGNGHTPGHLDITYQQPDVTFQREYVSSTVAPHDGDGYTYEKPSKQLTYSSPSTVTPSVSVYQRPDVTFQKQYVSSTLAPNTEEGYTYEKPKKQLTYNSPSTVTPSVSIYQRPDVTFQKQYVSSTVAPNTEEGYTYEKPKKQLTYNSPSTVTPSVSIYQRPGASFQNQYVGSTPAPDTQDGYTYEKPSKQLTYNSPSTVTPSVTIYQQPEVTYQKQVQYTPQSTIVPDCDKSHDGPSVSIRPAFNKQSNYQGAGYNVGSTAVPVSGSRGYDYPKPDVKFVSSTPAPVYTGNRRYPYRNGGSPAKVDISQEKITSLVDNYEYGNTRDSQPGIYVDANAGDSGFGNKLFGSSAIPSKTYQPTTPNSIIRTNSYNSYTSSTGGYTPSVYRTGGYSSTPLYEVSTVKPASGKGKGKVIVKLSDLHPLLLGKLGAQCTCRSDPFETLRGPGSKIVKSSRGDIDLAQYDESQIYVDLESDNEPSQSPAAYRTPSRSSTLSPSGYSSSLRTPVSAVFGLTTPAPAVFRSRGKPATVYLPVSSSPSPIENGGYGTSDNLDPQFVDLPAGFVRGDIPVGRSAGSSGRKAGKSLGSSGARGNAIGGAGAAFDRYGPGGLRDVDETLQGGSDCARAGLFRHPKFCNKFYACHWDEWKQKYTLHVFNCPVHLSFDNKAGACNWPSKGPACQDDNLLV